MAEAIKKTETKASDRGAPPEPVGRASESSDPAVHQLLARRQAAAMNDDAGQLTEVDAELVKLGFTEYQH